MRTHLFLALIVLVSANAVSAEDRWLVRSQKLYVSPDTAPLANGWVLLKGGKIEAVGGSSTAPPKGARTNAACDGGVVLAGFQNSHVHFTDASFNDAGKQPVAQLNEALAKMLVSWGFTTVTDTGSDLFNTVAMRKRIESGEVKGPTILTVGIPIYPEKGLPIYLKDLPEDLKRQMPLPATAAEALAVVDRNFANGANGTKLFVATPQGDNKIKRMAPEIERAAAEATHKHGGLVMAHPTDPQGVQDSVAGGVDIIVHTTIDPPKAKWTPELVSEMISHKVSLVPTLMLWGYELDKWHAPPAARAGAIHDAGVQLKMFLDAGGLVLFGTDVGYMSNFNPTDEYVYMAQAGMTTAQILTSLTTAPAARWKQSDRRGVVKQGLAADLTVLNGDPATDVKNFSNVKCTISGGREIYRAK